MFERTICMTIRQCADLSRVKVQIALIDSNVLCRTVLLWTRPTASANGVSLYPD